MEDCLRPMGFMKFLQHNNHQADNNIYIYILYIYIYILAVPGHTLLWLSLFK